MAWRHDWPAAALGLAAIILILPLWQVSLPAMPDYPAHMAGFYLIGGGASAFYRVRWAFVPNLAGELLVPPLARLVGLSAAIKLFLSAAVAMWVAGPGCIQRALTGRIGIAPLFAAFFAMNANYFWGFFNYYFAAGLSLMVFAAWIATAKRAGRMRTLLFAIAVTFVYFCHIFAAASLLVLIAGYETMRDGSPTARARDVLLVFLPAAFAFFALKPGGGGLDIQFDLAETMRDRFESLILYHFDAPSYWMPLAILALFLLALGLRHARIRREMLPALAVLGLSALLAPEWAMGGWAVHLRLPAYFCALLLAAAEVTLETEPALAAAAAALAVMGWNANALSGAWRYYDRQYTEFRAALGHVPRNTKLLTVLDGDSIGWAADQPYWHMAALAIIRRGAMTQLMFATPGQHVVQIIPPHDRHAARTAEEGSPPDIGELDDLAAGNTRNDPDIREIFPYLLRFQCHYDMAVVIHRSGRESPAPGMLRRAYRGSFFSLYDILRDPSCAAR